MLGWHVLRPPPDLGRWRLRAHPRGVHCERRHAELLRQAEQAVRQRVAKLGEWKDAANHSAIDKPTEAWRSTARAAAAAITATTAITHSMHGDRPAPAIGASLPPAARGVESNNRDTQ